jgi:hypothetical protein
MEFQLPITISSPPHLLAYGENILLTGSCFTEHIGQRLHALKFSTMQNPSGILFEPASVADSLLAYMRNTAYQEADLFYFNELWRSWQHHSSFSKTDKNELLEKINLSQEQTHQFLKKANWLIITLGSAFFYSLTSQAPQAGTSSYAANCHRAPGSWFNKRLLSIEQINASFDACLHQLFRFNPDIRVIFTVSPVRHIRDGVIENNRSKARLLEAVHQLVDRFDRLYYFPAYELVIDILRDYRFFDIDMVHPNYQATAFVFEQFALNYMDTASQELMAEINKIVTASRHKAFQPSTSAHKQFLKSHFEKTSLLKAKYPFLDLEKELNYFASANQI